MIYATAGMDRQTMQTCGEGLDKCQSIIMITVLTGVVARRHWPYSPDWTEVTGSRRKMAADARRDQ